MRIHQCSECAAGRPENCVGGEGYQGHFGGWTCSTALVEQPQLVFAPYVDPRQTLLSLLFGDTGPEVAASPA